MRFGRIFRFGLPSIAARSLSASVLLLRTGGCAKIVVPVLARLLPVSDVSVPITPLRFSTSDSRSESNDNVEEIEGKATCVCVRGRLVDGGLDRGRGSECCGGVIEVRGDDEGVDAGVTGEYERRGGGGSGYERCEISIGRLRRKNKCAEKAQSSPRQKGRSNNSAQPVIWTLLVAL